MEDLFAGLDVSTQGQKIVIIDLEKRSVIYSDSINYDVDLPKYNTLNGVLKDTDFGVSESNPNMWIDSLHLLFERLKTSSDIIQSIKSISVAGQQHGLVAIDKDGNLAKSTSKLWNDFSTAEECEILTNEIGGSEQMITEVANSQRTGYTASKIFHMYRNERELYDNTEHFLLVHNYINWYLTGGKIAMEEGDASGTGIWDPVTKTWSENLMNIISDDLVSKLPIVSSATKSIGYISNNLANQYGFDLECRIDAGSGDNMYSALGTGNIEYGTVTISLGTSGTAFTTLDQPFVDKDGEIACFCDSTGKYLPLLCISNMAGGYNTFLEENNLSHTDFETLLTQTPPGNNGNIIIPWYSGERTPDIPEACPIYFGFKYEEMNIKSIARGLIEGHVLNLFAGFSKMPVNPDIIHLTGGLSQSKSWCQMIADIFDCETVPVKGEGAALGAAIHAAWVWKNENGLSCDLAQLVNPFIIFEEGLRCKPDKKNVKIYQNLFLSYEALVKRVLGLEGSDPFKLRKEFFLS
tara:strand:- start:2943 stop:4508 length:1566 start_codon:yes stop_codon:yes gene_type:complete